MLSSSRLHLTGLKDQQLPAIVSGGRGQTLEVFFVRLSGNVRAGKNRDRFLFAIILPTLLVTTVSSVEFAVSFHCLPLFDGA